MTVRGTAESFSALSGAGITAIDLGRIVGLWKRLCGPNGGELFDGPVVRRAAAEPLLARHCCFDHIALLIFPSEHENVLTVLDGLGAAPGPVTASYVVRDRLARRYGLAVDRLDVRLVHARIPGSPDPGRGIEVFSLPHPGLLTEMAVCDERSQEHEKHVAFTVPAPSDYLLRELSHVLVRLGMLPDGGGYNPCESPESGGVTVLYFAGVGERLELKFLGSMPGILRRHLAGSVQPPAAEFVRR